MLIDDIIWGMLRRRMEDVYSDTLYGVDNPFWDTLEKLENVLKYWTDHRIDHAFVSYGHWATMIDF